MSRSDVEQTIQARFEHVVHESGDRLALAGEGRAWTYDALNRDANRLAHGILARLGPTSATHEPVAFLLPQSPEMVVATLAILKTGRPYLAMHPRMPAAAMAEIVRDAAPPAIVTNRELTRLAADVAAGMCPVLAIEDADRDTSDANPSCPARPDDPATIFFTSGTTGRPKGVVRSHRVVVHRAWVSAQQEGVVDDDRRSLLTHCSFAASQADLAGALLLGTTLCVFDVVPRGLDALASWIDAERITIVRPPVQLFRRLVTGIEPDRQFRSVRLVSLGGDAIVPEDVEAWKRHFPRPGTLIYRFSSTETTLLTTAMLDHESDPPVETLSVGRPVPDRVITLLNDEGDEVAPGETGEIVVTSEYLADGYWRVPEETQARFTVDPDDPRRRSFRTGDLGRFLPDGRLVLEGRRDQIVKIRGFRVNMREVEEAICRVQSVADAAVVASRVEAEQQLVAFVVMGAAQTFDGAALRQALRAQLPEWKIPARVHSLDVLPTTPNGKIDRRRLLELSERADALSGESSSPDAAALDHIEAQVGEIFQRVLRCGPVGRTDDFFLLGGDSLRATLLHQQIERALDVRFPLEALVKEATVAAVAAAVRVARATTDRGTDGTSPVLVPLRIRGGRRPLFLVHGRLGQAFVSPHFLEVFGADQPVYAFQATGLDSKRNPETTIETMATEYLRAMRQVQSAGPYLIVAACVGAMVAAEMANQLRREGEAVGPLVFIDPPVSAAGDRSMAARLRQRTRWFLKSLVGRGRASSERRLQRRADQGRIALDTADAGAVDAAAEAIRRFEIARRKHRRWRYDGPVLLLRSADRLARDGPQRRGPFSRHLTGEIRWFNVGGRHSDVRSADNAQLGTALQEALTIARAAVE